MAKYQQYEEYKDSGVEWLGFIPKDWNIVKVKNQFDVFNGSTPKSGEVEYWEGNIVWVTPSDLSQLEGYKISESSRNITTKGLHSCGTSLVPKGSMILSCRAPIGSLAVAGTELCTNQGCKTLVPTSGIPVEYYYYYFSTVTNVLNNLGRGSTFLELSTEDLTNLAMPLPSISESYSVIAFLNHETAQIDTLIEKQQILIQLLKEKRQAVISHAVTKGLDPDAPMKDSGVEWLGEVPDHWVVCRIKDLSSIISKGTTPSTMGGELIDEGIRFLKAENIGKSEYVKFTPEFYISQKVNDQLARSKLEENDVLVIIAGATTGMASILQKELLPCNTNQAVSFIRPKNPIHSKWIAKWLSIEFSQRIIWMGAVQAAQPNLSMEDLGNIPITLPIGNEVAEIVKVIDIKLEKFDRLISKAEQAIQLMQERRTALISAAITGKIDVRGWIVPE